MSTCQPPEQYLNKLRERYRHATKEQRGKILDEFVETTGYHRKHAIALLCGLRHHRDPKLPLRHPRGRIYTDEDKRAVLWLAELFAQIGSKRLQVAMGWNWPTCAASTICRSAAPVTSGCGVSVPRPWIGCGGASDARPTIARGY